MIESTLRPLPQPPSQPGRFVANESATTSCPFHAATPASSLTQGSADARGAHGVVRYDRRAALVALGLGLPAAFLTTVVLPGCSLGVMAGKMLTGEPMQLAQFKQMTGVDLGKGKHTLVIICSTPIAVDQDLASLNIDLIEGITRRLKLHGVDVINPDHVARWIDESGGVIPEPAEMARAFDADYIAWIDMQGFTLREENSPKLLRGRTQGFVRVYQVQKIGGEKTALAAFNSEFTSTYPPHQPVSETGRSALLFQKEFVDRICDELAETFYDHRPGIHF